MNLYTNEPYSRAYVIAEMAIHFSNRQTKHDVILTRYYEAVSEHICEGVLYAQQNQLDVNQCPVNWDSLRRSVGKYNNPQKFWFDWLHENFPLIRVIKKGSNLIGQRTMVTPLHNTEWQKDVETILTPEEIWNYYFGHLNSTDWLDPSVVEFTPMYKRQPFTGSRKDWSSTSSTIS